MDLYFSSLEFVTGSDYSQVLTSVLGRNEVHIAHVVVAGLDMVVDGVGRHGADLYQPVVLDEDGVAGQVAVHDGRHATVQVADATNKGSRHFCSLNYIYTHT